MSWIVEKNLLQTFDNYKQSLNIYESKKTKVNELNMEIRELTGSLNESQRTVSELEGEIRELQNRSISDPQEQKDKLDSKLKEKIRELRERKELQITQEDLTEQREQNENDKWLEIEIGKIERSGTGISYDQLDENEKKAYDFSQKRMDLKSENDSLVGQSKQKIQKYNAEYSQFKKCKDEEILQIKNKYEPDLAKLETEIRRIEDSYRPKIDELKKQAQKYLDDVEDIRVDYDRQKLLEKNNAEQKIINLKSQYRDLERMIREKRGSGRGTSVMQSELQKIRARIDSAEASGNGKIQKLELEKEKKLRTPRKKIEAINEKLQNIQIERNQELKDPGDKFKKLQTARDRQIQSCVHETESKKSDMQSKKTIEEKKIKKYENDYISKLKALKTQMTQMAMSGNNCLDEKKDLVFKPFKELKQKCSEWDETAHKIAEYTNAKKYDKYITEHEESLTGNSYAELQKIIAECSELDNHIGSWIKYYKILTLVCCILSMGVMVLNHFVLNMSVLPAVLLPVAVLGAGFYIYNKAVSEKLGQYCKAVVIISDYETLPALLGQAKKLAEEEEYNRLKKSGDEINRILQREQELIEQENDLRKTHEQKFDDISKKHNEIRAGIERATKDEIRRLKSECEKQKENLDSGFKESKSELNRSLKFSEKELKDIKNKIQSIEEEIGNKTREKETCEDIINRFDGDYNEFTTKFNDGEIKMGYKESCGSLQDTMYVMSDVQKLDGKYNRVYEIVHEKNPLIFLYEEMNNLEQKKTQAEHIIIDLLNAVRNCNYGDVYRQYIVNDYNYDTFASTDTKNKFKIAKCAKKIEEISRELAEVKEQREKLVEAGTSINKKNEKNFKDGGEPEKVNVFYFAYVEAGQEMEKRALNEEIQNLLVDCSQYGFFPIFIFPKEKFDAERQKEDKTGTMCRDLLNRIKENFKIYNYNNGNYQETTI